jgi:hypothetical protein
VAGVCGDEVHILMQLIGLRCLTNEKIMGESRLRRAPLKDFRVLIKVIFFLSFPGVVMEEEMDIP